MAMVWFHAGGVEPYREVRPTLPVERTERVNPQPHQDPYTRAQAAYRDGAHQPGARRQPAIHLSQIMSSPVVTLPSEAPLRSAVLLLHEKNIRHLPVTEGKLLVGIVSDRDLLQHSLSTASLVKEVMTRKLLTGHPDTEIREAARVMIEQHIHCLPILDDDKNLVGIVTTTDILRAVVNRAPLDLWI